MTFKYKVLSIDGGGIRGIIPAMILAEIENRTGKRIHEMFDLIAGTSTGGIIALGLTMPSEQDNKQAKYYAKDLVELYKQEGNTIFKKNESFIEKCVEQRLREVLEFLHLPFAEIDELLSAKYLSEGRETVLNKYFGDTPIKEALTEVFITSYDTAFRLPVFFTSKRHKIQGRCFHKVYEGFTMKQAAMATSAAPTFFEPHKVLFSESLSKEIEKESNGYHKDDHYSLVDGGVFANNPTSLAVMEAIINTKIRDGEVEKEDRLELEDILVVSLGTGSLTRKYAYDQAKKWGLVKWINPLINILMDGTNESVAVQLEQLLAKHQYYRFQGMLDQNKGNDDMDDATPQNISNLEELAVDIINKERQKLEELCQML
ncbi:patatin-like phospholipase family protein [Aerosakkonemataceae cyanobacterium BLCC-F154]|uniref:Patatin-like phospholipase family protein n=1 Tax=Floridaenema fluviatile BLCC-F154 TaxID=3153640 RepID=A0ABV4YD91_9CYAN